ncbi:MAG: DUF2442 domain-containing protein [Magnetococcales bacterium]|nr:DUF2442 domain-containing protein [Magnetococcales bacterium]
MAKSTKSSRLKKIKANPESYTLTMIWMDGKKDVLDYSIIDAAFPRYKPIPPRIFSKAKISGEGWGVEWPGSNIDIGADTLQDYARMKFSKKGVMRVARFAAWVDKNWPHIVTDTDKAFTMIGKRIGISSRKVEEYRTGKKKMPKTVWLAMLADDAGLV